MRFDIFFLRDFNGLILFRLNIREKNIHGIGGREIRRNWIQLAKKKKKEKAIIVFHRFLLDRVGFDLE